MDQNDFSGSDQIQTPKYPDVHPPSQEKSEEVSQAREDLIKSIQTFLEEFHCIPLEEKPTILLFKGAGRIQGKSRKFFEFQPREGRTTTRFRHSSAD
nr:hypothetical protein [Tanacetum cinerariifolium]